MESDSRGCPELMRHSGHVEAYVRTETCALEWISVWISSGRRHRSPLESKAKRFVWFVVFFGSANVLGVNVQPLRNGFLLLIRVVHVAKFSLSLICGFFLFRKLLHVNLEFGAVY